MITLQDRFLGSLIGLATGDALGAPVEFKKRGEFPFVTMMAAGGPFDLKKGQWTDDTSLALCLGKSLIEKKGFDPYDQAQKYLSWFREGYMSCTGNCFDIGNTTKATLITFEETKEVYTGDVNLKASNGSLMRLAPVALFFHGNMEKVKEFSRLSSKVTHMPQECVETCGELGEYIEGALNGLSKKEIFKNSKIDFSKTYEELNGEGLAITCLEAAMWCFYHTENFNDAIIKAVNIGDDTDTTAAVCGQVAGAYYGISGIKKEFLDDLWDKNIIEEVALDLYKINQGIL